MKKKAGITQHFLIGLIILVVAAALLFYFFRQIPYKESSEKEACHKSVVLRNEIFLRGELVLEVPLRCKTQKIKIDSTNEETIKREIANTMYDCWWMLGQGKMNFFQRKPTLGNPSYCVICATIEFDEKVQKKIKKIDGILLYLIKTKVPGKNISYWEFLQNAEAPIEKLPVEISLETNRKYALVYSLTEKSTLLGSLGGGTIMGLAGAFAGAAIGTIILPGAGTVVGSLIAGKISTVVTLTGALAGTTFGIYTGNEIGDKLQELIEKNDYWVSFMLVPFEAEAIKQLKCSSIESIP
ncbi:MAG: hypothetical protein NZ889_00270 [Candidatus Pacearchaeota archaeon]|nr:hypothetical protein [Candidatus Pacearchaeota archaeon]